MKKSESLRMFVIYDHPSDFPNFYVCREWEVITGTPEPKPLGLFMHSKDLEEIRTALLKKGLVCLPREENDDAKIIESYI